MKGIAAALSAWAKIVTEGSKDSDRAVRTILILATMAATIVAASAPIVWVLVQLAH